MAASNINLIRACDNWPCSVTEPDNHAGHLKAGNGGGGFWRLVDTAKGNTIGYIPLDVIKQVEREGLKSQIILNPDVRQAWIAGSTAAERTAVVDTTMRRWAKEKSFRILEGWREEKYPVYTTGGKVHFEIERAASALFGIVTYGVHMTAYQRDHQNNDKLYIWVPRRAWTKATYPGILDNSVAGGLPTGESALDCLIRESEEEASLPEDVVRSRVQSVGTVSYFFSRDEQAGGESGLAQPECQYVFDLDLTDSGYQPTPNDEEVDSFQLWDVPTVKDKLAKGEFKPNCGLVLIDFLVRHGYITAATEKQHFAELVSRMHRRLEFPMP